MAGLNAGKTRGTVGRQEGRTLWRVYVFSLALAAAVLFFCSKSSFAYPINDWSDANVYFSAGKGMLAGRVMYRDLYDHKGPLIYALHALCAWVCPGSFAGVYALECLFAAAFLTGAYRLIALYGGSKAGLWALPLLAMTIYASYSFQAGDSAEELALPLMLYPVYHALAWVKAGEGRPPRRLLPLLDGAAIGCVFWMKFTLCGAPGAAMLALLIFIIRDKGWKAGGQAVAWMLAGFLAATLPWVVYFGGNGALTDWLKTYLYDNLFLYSQGEEPLSLLSRCKLAVRSAWDWFAANPAYSLPVVLGLGWAAFGKGLAARERLIWLGSFALGALGVFITGRTYPYYALALAVFAPVFFLPLCQGLARRKPQWLTGRRLQSATAGLCLLCAGLCAAISPNVAQSFGQPRRETMQYQLAAVIRQTPGATLLNYGFMDAGFYTAAGVTPTVKYFHRANVPLQEMLDEQERYIADGVCDYVVTRGWQPAWIVDRYDLVVTADSPGFWYEHVYLYRKKGL